MEITGKDALGIGTHHLKSINFIKYTSQQYSRPAIKMGSGVQAWVAYEAASTNGVRVIGGTCPTIGLAGGYSQGGGHSTLSSLYGLGADQALEWEVVTADGQHLVATPTQHSDLYWALSRGGGGSYAVVLSLTPKRTEMGWWVERAFLFPPKASPKPRNGAPSGIGCPRSPNSAMPVVPHLYTRSQAMRST